MKKNFVEHQNFVEHLTGHENCGMMVERAKGCSTIGEVIALAGRVYPKVKATNRSGYKNPFLGDEQGQLLMETLRTLQAYEEAIELQEDIEF